MKIKERKRGNSFLSLFISFYWKRKKKGRKRIRKKENRSERNKINNKRKMNKNKGGERKTKNSKGIKNNKKRKSKKITEREGNKKLKKLQDIRVEIFWKNKKLQIRGKWIKNTKNEREN